ncbi:hypothetical protein [Hyphomicrobium sp.]|uniref:hypothetical protein n=1 Tax=Hyphomicrobium sp. TaxID=82 RepID=UPI001DB5F7DE|nr:hypothetical protein [Hyphomicrobium sp.]MBY0562463.1 hypothetical protein [Hyphomicrobium sp.]
MRDHVEEMLKISRGRLGSPPTSDDQRSAQAEIDAYLQQFPRKQRNKLIKEVRARLRENERLVRKEFAKLDDIALSQAADKLWNVITASGVNITDFFERCIIEKMDPHADPLMRTTLAAIGAMTTHLSDTDIAQMFALAIKRHGAPHHVFITEPDEAARRVGLPGTPYVGRYAVDDSLVREIESSVLDAEGKSLIIGLMRRTPPEDRSELALEIANELEKRRRERPTAVPGLHNETVTALGRLESDIERQLAATRSELVSLERLKALQHWAIGNDLKLENPNGSAFHKLIEADKAGRTFDMAEIENPISVRQFMGNGEPRVFVVEHDWASAFEGAGEFDQGAFRLPFDLCAFEFRISGRRVAVLVKECVNETLASVICVDCGEDTWGCGGYVMRDIPPTRTDGDFNTEDETLEVVNLTRLINAQVRAVCISLEAEVAESEVIRAPTKLNAARAKKGKAPLKDYHIVSLANRKRNAALPEELRDFTETGRRRPRMHFRRGHWRHYAKHKTWVKWMLCGSPDLGFINKHYKL